MKAETKTKIKDWFIITRIRVLNFIKEHKYFSAGIGVFLLTAFIAFIVRAVTDETISNATLVMEGEYQPRLNVITESSDNIKAPNFSTITYNISYYLDQGDSCGNNEISYKSDEVEIQAILPDTVKNVKWGRSDETTSSSVSEDGRVITIKAPLVNMCSFQTQNVTLHVLNADQNMSITPTIKIKGGTNSSFQTVTDTITVPTVTTYYDSDKNYELQPLVKGGIAEKIDDAKRNVIFGILLGIKSNNEITSLKGAHLNTSADIILLASQKNGSDLEYLDIYTENSGQKKYFDKYNNDLHYFVEGSIPDLSTSSGNVNSLSKDDYVPSNIILNTNKTPIVKMNAPKIEEYEQYPTSINYSDSINITDKEGYKYSNIIKKIYKGDSTDSIKQIPLNEKGTYKIQYTVNGTNSSTTMVRTINVVEPKNNNYSLKGAKTIYVEKNGKYSEQGLYKTSTSSEALSSDYSVKYLAGANEVSISDMVSNIGTYTAKYIITDTNEEIERKIEVVEGLPSETSSEVSVTDSVISKGSNYVSQGLKINNEDKNCNSDNNCSYEPTTINSSSVGEETIKYTINKNGNVFEVSKKVYITPQYYKLSISDIIPSSTSINKVSDDFYAIGSYYVTVGSTRSNDTNNIDVYLKAIGSTSESEAFVTNTRYSTGDNSSVASNVMYVNEKSEYVPVISSSKNGLTGNYYTAAMGEEVKMVSKFEYGYDADDDISELKISIPVDGNLIPIAYGTEVSTDSYFGLSIKYHGAEKKGTPIKEIKYYDSEGKEINFDEFDEDTQVIDHITIIIKKAEDNSFKIEPGTTIEITTKYKVKTYKATDEEAKNLSMLKFNGNVTFEWNSNGSTLSKSASTGHDVYITPYKARTSVGIGKNDNYNMGSEIGNNATADYNPTELISLDASKNEVYTIFASTDVSAPAMNIKSNIFGYNRIKILPIIIELPVGFNYVYNKEYTLEPTVTYNADKTYLTYNYLNVEPNSWMEPLYVDFNVDVSVVSEISDIKIYVGDPNNKNVSISNDVSSINVFKTITKRIQVENVEKVSYGQYIYSDGKYVSNIGKDSSFEFSTKLHSNLENDNATNLMVYTILPYNDTKKESTYSGSIFIEGLPSNAVCTNDDPSMITKADQVGNVNWQDCTNFKTVDEKYSNFTAYKVTYDNLAPNDDIETKVKIFTMDNKPDDSYTFKSYLSYNVGDFSSGYKNFRDIKLDVVSKKITGVVWEDFNVDGIMDASEKKIENVNLKLYNVSDELIQTTTPSSEGRYTFSAVPAGTYYVVADFNTDKYGVTGSPSEDFYDKTRLSAFKEVLITKETSEENQIVYSDDDFSNDEADTSDDVEDSSEENMSIIKTDNITIENETRIVRNINLGLSLRKKFEVKVNKYITRVEVTNALGVVTSKDYGNVKLAKLDVKDINNLKIKVIYTIEIQNIKYYPGYVNLITEEVPDGMSFNPNYDENKGWTLNEVGTLTNSSISNEVISENEKKYLTVAFDITRKEAGSFINFVSVDELEILGGIKDE